MDPLFRAASSKSELETGTELTPRFDTDGLVPCVATHAETGEVLMLAYMNDVALSETLKTGFATYWSRSRGKLWKKGETSGEIQKVVELRTDCDQDAIWIRVLPQGEGATCHRGFATCFYRKAELGAEGGASRLGDLGLEQIIDPEKTYGS